VFFFKGFNQNRQQPEVLFCGLRKAAAALQVVERRSPVIPVDQFCEVSSEEVGRVLAV
jgi:hypothetical protein